jgi:hypothetical protein
VSVVNLAYVPNGESCFVVTGPKPNILVLLVSHLSHVGHSRRQRQQFKADPVMANLRPSRGATCTTFATGGDV